MQPNDSLQEQIRTMQNRIRMGIDRPNSTLANRLSYDMRRLQKNVEDGKSRAVIANDMQQMQKLVREAQQTEVMGYTHASVINSWLDDSIKKMQ